MIPPAQLDKMIDELEIDRMPDGFGASGVARDICQAFINRIRGVPGFRRPQKDGVAAETVGLLASGG